MKKNYLLLFLLFSFTSIYSQSWLENLPQDKSKDELTFFDYKNAFESYWAPFNVDKGFYMENGVQKKAVGWKQFKRWEYDMEYKIDPTTGQFPSKTAFQVFEEFKQINPDIKSPAAANWTSMGPSNSQGGYAGVGRINCIAYHPSNNNIYWVGAASGGLWVTTNNGSSWTCLTDQNNVLAVSDIAIPSDFTTSNTIYIATGDKDGWDNTSVGVLKSTDGGLSWNTTGLSFNLADWKMVNRLLLDPSNNQTILAATTNGVYKTTNGGTTWSTQLTTTNFIDMEYKPGNFATLYGSTTNGKIYVSTNSGSSWTQAFYISSTYRIELAVSANQSAWVYAVAQNSVYGLYGVYKSTNSGVSFTSVFSGSTLNLLGWESNGMDSGGQGWYDLSLAVSPSNASTLLVGGINTWRSTNGGTSWFIVSHWAGDGVPAVHADKHSLSFRNNGDLFECNDGGVYSSTNNGTTWTDRTNGMVISQMYKLGNSATVANEVITGLQDNGTKLVSNSSWSDVKGGDGMECLIDYNNVNVQYGTYVYGQISRTTNHWSTAIPIEPSAAGDGAWVTPFIISPVSSQTIYAGYENVWKTTNRGDSWTKISTMNSSAKIRSMAIAPSNTQVLYVADLTHIWKTTNDGSSWSNITGSLPINIGSLSYITVKNDDANTIWVTLSGFNASTVYQSVNGGTTWINISGGLPQIPAYSIVQNKQETSAVHLYVGTELGVYFKNGLNDWVPFNTGLPNVKIGEIEIYYASNPADSKLRAATYGRGLWQSGLTVESSGTPSISISPSELTESHTNPPQQTTKIVTVSNTGTGPLSFDLAVNATQKVVIQNTPEDYERLYKRMQADGISANILGEDNSNPGGGSAFQTKDVTLRYDDGYNYTAVGLIQPGTFRVAVYFPAATMGLYAGMKLDQVLIYIHHLPSSCILNIYGQGTSSSPGELLHQQTITPTANSWNLISLSNRVDITGQDLWIGYQVTHSAAKYPAGCDNGPHVTNGNWISTNGTTWNELHVSNPSLDYNWNIAGYLVPGTTYTNDVGVQSLVSPVSGANLGNESVTVKVKNFGTAPQSNITVSYTLNGGTAVTGTIAGPLLAGASYDYTFPGTVNLSTIGQTYVFNACATIAGDQNIDNDCKSFNITNLILVYCDATTTTQDEYIGNVLFGTINNTSGWQGGVANYTAQSTIIEPGASQSITVANPTPYASDLVTAWVDWNLDSNFGTGGSEEYILSGNALGSVFTGAISVPAGTPEGMYRMRIRLTYSTLPIPCGNASYGEVEEYTIQVSDGTTQNQWLSASPLSGSIPAGNSTQITVTFNSEGLDLGTYNGSLVFTSNDPNTPVITVPALMYVGANSTLTVTPSNQNVTATAGSTTFTVASNTSWTVTESVSWLSVSPPSGSNNGTLTVSYDANTTTSPKTGQITVTAAGGSPVVIITVTQAAANVTLTVTPSNQNVAATAGSTSFSVTSNTSWTVTESVSWLTVSPMSGNNNATLSVNYDANPSPSARTGQITVTAGGGSPSVVVTVTQAGANVTLSVTPPNQNVAATAGSTSFSVTSNTSWTVTESVSWITSVSPSSGSGNGTVTVNYQQNTGAQRTGQISFTASGGSPVVNVTVTQSGPTPNLTLSLPTDATGANGTTVSIPISLTNPNSVGIEGVDVVVTFNSSILNATATGGTIDGTVLAGQNYGSQFNTSTPGSISMVLYANAGLYTGGGVIAYLNFTVTGSQNQTSPLTFLTYKINEQQVNKIDGLFTVTSNLFDISGNITYFNDITPVPTAEVKLLGGSTYNTNSNVSGDFSFLNKEGGNYVLSASKTNDLDGLSGTDASRVARYAAGIFTFNDYEKIAADVSMDGTISGTDASRIARYVAGLITTLNTNNTNWVFVTSLNNPGNWPPISYESTYSYSPLNGDMTYQDMTGIRLGDVTGNWTPSSAKSVITLNSLEAANLITSQKTISIPIEITDMNVIEGIDIKLLYNNEALKFNKISLNNDVLNPDNYNLYSKFSDGIGNITIYAQDEPVRVKGIIAFIEFDILENSNRIVDLGIAQFIVNENNVEGNLQIEDSENNLIKAKSIKIDSQEDVSQNSIHLEAYPNPFSSLVTIKYNIPTKTKVSIQIFDCYGQLIDEVVEQKEVVGNNEVKWDASTFGNGIYYCLLSTQNETKSIKLIIVK